MGSSCTPVCPQMSSSAAECWSHTCRTVAGTGRCRNRVLEMVLEVVEMMVSYET